MANLSKTSVDGTEVSGLPAVLCPSCKGYGYDPVYHIDICPSCGQDLNKVKGLKFKLDKRHIIAE